MWCGRDVALRRDIHSHERRVNVGIDMENKRSPRSRGFLWIFSP